MYVALSVMARDSWAEALAALGVRAVCLPALQLVRKRHEDVREILTRYKDAGAWIMLDSSAGAIQPEGENDLEKYLEKYLDFVEAHQDLLDCWTEFDPVAYCPLQQVVSWRARWLERGLVDRLVVMYHGDDSVLDGTYKHVGLSAGEPDSYYSRFFREYTATLRDAGVKVYGRGVTRAALLQLPWFAVDSTTWTAWGRWGHLFFWNPAASRLEIFAQPDVPDLSVRNELRMREFDRRRIWEDAEKYDLATGLRVLDGWSVDRWNALQWIRLQQYMEGQVGNAYWLSVEEKQALVASRRDRNRAAVVAGGGGTFGGELAASPQAAPATQVGRYCDSCVISDKCPVYRPGGDCGLSQLRPITSMDDVLSAVQNLLAMQYDRVQFAAMVERVQGGHLSKDVTRNMEMFMDLLLKMKDLSTAPAEEVTITAKGGGIISRVFGNLIESAKQSTDHKPPPIEVIDLKE